MAPRTPLPPRHHSGTTLNLPWYHRTVRHSPSHSPPPSPVAWFAPPVASIPLTLIRRRFPLTHAARGHLPGSLNLRFKLCCRRREKLAGNCERVASNQGHCGFEGVGS